MRAPSEWGFDVLDFFRENPMASSHYLAKRIGRIVLEAQVEAAEEMRDKAWAIVQDAIVEAERQRHKKPWWRRPRANPSAAAAQALEEYEIPDDMDLHQPPR